MQKIKPCLWFNTEAHDAAKFYCSLFKKSKITSVSYYGENAPMPKGTVMVVEFTLNGQQYQALSGNSSAASLDSRRMITSRA